MIWRMDVFAGYVWYVYPLKKLSSSDAILVDGGQIFPLKYFDDAKMFSNYNDEGVIVITKEPKKPEVNIDWDCVPLNVPDGFGGVVDNTVLRHVYTENGESDLIYSVFVGLKLPLKV
jgi:hypothetical protein